MGDDYQDRAGAFVHRLANVAPSVRIGVGSRVDAFVTITGDVSIGQRVHISHGVGIFGGHGVEIGDYSAISANVSIFSSTEDLSGSSFVNPCCPSEYRHPISRRIRIGRHCVVGAGSVLLPGAELADGACTGAVSMVKAPLAEWAIYAGAPAKFIKYRRNDILNAEAA